MRCSLPPQVALLITPVASARALAGLGKLAAISGTAFATEHGAVLLLSDASYAASQEASARLSQALAGGELLLLRRGPSEDPADSDVQAARFAEGKFVKKLAPGLVLSGLDNLCEKLILGTLEPAGLDSATDAIQTDTLSRFAALRALKSGRKKKP